MRRLFATLALAGLLSSCAGLPIGQAPTAMPAPTTTPAPTLTATAAPTATLAPTATVTAAPTATAASAPTAPTAAAQVGVPAELAAAIGRTAAVQTYSAELLVLGEGFPGAAGGAPAQLLTLSGRFDGPEHQFAAAGALTAFFGADPTAGLEAIRADGQSYVRGPLALIGATEPAWYRLPPERAMLAEPPFNPATLSRLLAATDLSAAGLVPGAAETRDGQQCTPYAGGTEATLALLRSLVANGGPQFVSLDQVREGTTTVFACADGYVHTVVMELSGTFPADQPVPFSLILDARLADFDGAITIDPPADVRELPTAGSTP